MKYRIVSLLFLALLGGCFGGRPVETEHFFVPTLSPAEDSRPLPFSLQVELLQTAPHLRGDRLAARVAATEIEYYRNYRWAGSLDRLVTQEVMRFLRPAGAARFPAASTDGRPAYRLEGILELFEEEAEGDTYYGRVGLSLSLTDAESGGQVWGRYYEGRQEASARNPQAVVRALTKVLHYFLSEAQTEWYDLAVAKGSP